MPLGPFTTRPVCRRLFCATSGKPSTLCVWHPKRKWAELLVVGGDCPAGGICNVMYSAAQAIGVLARSGKHAHHAAFESSFLGHTDRFPSWWVDVDQPMAFRLRHRGQAHVFAFPVLLDAAQPTLSYRVVLAP